MSLYIGSTVVPRQRPWWKLLCHPHHGLHQSWPLPPCYDVYRFECRGINDETSYDKKRRVVVSDVYETLSGRKALLLLLTQ